MVLPGLDRLGGGAWQAKKAKLKERIRQIAERLMGLGAERRDGQPCCNRDHHVQGNPVKPTHAFLPHGLSHRMVNPVPSPPTPAPFSIKPDPIQQGIECSLAHDRQRRRFGAGDPRVEHGPAFPHVVVQQVNAPIAFTGANHPWGYIASVLG